MTLPLLGWRGRAAVFNLLQLLPGGESLHLALNRRFSKPHRVYSPTASSASVQIRHLEVLRRHKPDIKAIRLLEFGAGWDLYANLVYYCMGIDQQITVDLKPWVKASALNNAIRHLQAEPPAGHVRVPTQLVSEGNVRDDLLRHYGIDYRAPFDMSATGLPDASVDAIVTTSVLEHIPASMCKAIFTECRRITAPGGMMSHTIDYSDHYAHADSRITRFNYLGYDDLAWRPLNSGMHFQNRLRSPDFRQLFEAASFQVLEQEEWYGKQEDLDRVAVDARFKYLSNRDLLALGCHFLMASSD